MKVVLVVPAYNEGTRIRGVIEDASRYVDEVVVVDDGSMDETYPQARRAEGAFHVLRHRVNLGKGAALKTGCEAARRRGAEVIVMVDGDGQHPVRCIPEILRLMEERQWQAVFTYREGGGKMPLVRYLGNRILNLMARKFFSLNLRDMWCGFRVIRAEHLPKIIWSKCDYGGEIQMALKIGRSGLRYGEFQIPIIYNDEAKGVTIIHGLKLLVQMIIWRIKL